MARHKVVLKKQWLAARKALLAKEKRFTKLQGHDESDQGPGWVRRHDEYGD